jgi:predicted nucleotidyltransferase
MSVAHRNKKLDIQNHDPLTFQLLIEISACDIEKPLPKVNVDWKTLLYAIESQGISGLAYYTFYQNKDTDYPPQVFQEKLWEYHRYISLQMVDKYQRIKSVISLLKERGIEFLILKGPATAEAIYPEPSLRYYVDLDLLAHPGDRNQVLDALCALGYKSEAGYLDPLPKLIPTVVNDHHTVFFHPESNLPVEVHWEDLLIDDLVPRDLSGMWRRAVPITIEGIKVKTLCLEDSLLHLCVHAHHHRFDKLYRISDLLFILRDHFDEINWNLFLQTVRIEEAQVPVYYSFRLVSQLYGLALPEELMDQLKPDGFRRWLHKRFY